MLARLKGHVLGKVALSYKLRREDDDVPTLVESLRLVQKIYGWIHPAYGMLMESDLVRCFILAMANYMVLSPGSHRLVMMSIPCVTK